MNKENTAAPLYSDDLLMLSVDTSTASMSVSLSRGGRRIGEISSRAERNHSLYIVTALQQVMAEAGVQPREVSGFAVGIGPGSYTGTRIGVTVAKTFAWSHGMALMGISTLEAMALGGADRMLGGESEPAESGLESSAQLESESDDRETVIVGPGRLDVLERLRTEAAGNGQTTWIIPLIEARRGQAFTGLYVNSPSGWSVTVPDSIRLITVWLEELLELARNHKPDRIWFTGEMELHMEAIQSFTAAWEGRAELTPQATHAVRASQIAELGRGCWERGETDDVHGLVPNYTQLAEAEARLLAAKRA